MSGTSLDGVDAAILDTDGETIFGFGPSVTVPFDSGVNFEAVIAAALAWGFKGPQPAIFVPATQSIHAAHIKAVEALPTTDFELIGFHGQTVLHKPAIGDAKGQTLQLGDGQILADYFNVPCVFDFRSSDVAAGGQGAPLAPIYHKALCDYSNLTGRIAVVNIGGVSNVTLIDGDAPLLATDCGPGNGPLDSWMQHKTRQSFDKDGQACLAGTPDFAMIEAWLQADFFKRPMPRSADRYDFDVLGHMSDVSLHDGAATLASFAAQAIVRDLNAFDPETIIVCGGGRLNPAILNMLTAQSRANVCCAEAVGWDGDALEAQAFAYMAVRCLRGLALSFTGTTGVERPVSGGRIARSYAPL